MALRKLIKDGRVVDDAWTVIRPTKDTALPSIPAQGPVIVPLALWLALREELSQRADPCGVWLGPADEPAELADDIANLELIAVDFPVFRDGRGYSIARLLRERYGYRGELRAIGDVLRDQLFYLRRCGFNAFAVREDRNIDEALASLSDFSEVYQASVEQPLPLFRRRVS